VLHPEWASLATRRLNQVVPGSASEIRTLCLIGRRWQLAQSRSAAPVPGAHCMPTGQVDKGAGPRLGMCDRDSWQGTEKRSSPEFGQTAIASVSANSATARHSWPDGRQLGSQESEPPPLLTRTQAPLGYAASEAPLRVLFLLGSRSHAPRGNRRRDALRRIQIPASRRQFSLRPLRLVFAP
jgi:hypothetical protein